MKEVEADQACPCNSGKSYGDCCGPLIRGLRYAETALELMRSRYTAFTQEASSYIRESWHVSSRPRSLDFEGHPVSWLSLEVHDTSAGLADDNEGEVEFTASYLENGMLCRLRERSHFEREDGRWYYRSGECEVAKSKVERNRPCPCGSGKKFKRCCLMR